MLPTTSFNSSNKSERKLNKLFKKLNKEKQQTLLSFATFLVLDKTEIEGSKSKIMVPKFISRPEKESVIKAIKRLSTSYFMIDSAEMFNTTSALMSEHIMKGRAANEVIDELEQVFKKHYENMNNKR